MANSLQSKQNEIKSLLDGYCNEHLDNEYINLCDKLFNNLLEYDQEIFKRGEKSIWAASIVWAVGSANFLSDKSSEPYATLAGVCNYFGTNTSTVGQKASKIREWFDIDYYNENYSHSNNTVTDLLKSLVVNENGLIIFKDWLNKENGIEFEDEEDESGEEIPDHYIIVIDSRVRFTQADLYQLEYLFETLLSYDEKFEKFEIIDSKKVHLYFFGRPAIALNFDKQLNRQKFFVYDIINQPVNDKDLNINTLKGLF